VKGACPRCDFFTVGSGVGHTKSLTEAWDRVGNVRGSRWAGVQLSWGGRPQFCEVKQLNKRVYYPPRIVKID
jgi:hypothetical protein